MLSYVCSNKLMALCIAVGTSMSRAIRHRASSAMLGLLSVGVALSDLCAYVEQAKEGAEAVEGSLSAL